MCADFVTYFGYGSLVNRDTRPASESARPARLYGWRRVWGHRVLTEGLSCDEVHKSSCALSLQKIPAAELHGLDSRPYIDGVIVTILEDDLPALDEREQGYDRLLVSRTNFDLPEDCKSPKIHVYVSKATHKGPATNQFPVLQSYIDCTLAGYNNLFERQGLEHFISTTDGWEGVVVNDRTMPKYPRAVNISEDEASLFDQLIHERTQYLNKGSNK